MSLAGALPPPAPVSAYGSRLMTHNMMLDRARERTLLDEIDARQDEVLQSLDELNGRIEEVLRRELGRKSAEAAALSVQMPGLIDGSQQPEAQHDACPQA
jgi:hypothetical protein